MSLSAPKPPRGRRKKRKKSDREKAVIKSGRRATRMLTKRGKDPLAGYRFTPRVLDPQPFPSKKVYDLRTDVKAKNEDAFNKATQKFKRKNKKATVLTN